MPKPFPSPGGNALFGRRSARALAAVEAVLSEAESVRDVKPDALQALCAEHGVDLARQARGRRRRIYSQYLEHCLEDAELSDEEAADLAHLREILHLDPSDVDSLHEEVGRSVYGRALADVLCDLKIDEAERAFLRRLRSEVGLSENEAEKLQRKQAWEAREQALAGAVTPDPLFSAARVRAGDFTGRSSESLEAAISDGLANARRAIPGLHWFEVERIAGYVGDDGVRGWHVTLIAGLDPSDAKRR